MNPIVATWKWLTAPWRSDGHGKLSLARLLVTAVVTVGLVKMLAGGVSGPESAMILGLALYGFGDIVTTKTGKGAVLFLARRGVTEPAEVVSEEA